MSDGNQASPPSPDRREIDRMREEYGLSKPASPSGKLVTSGIEFAGIVVACILIGLWLDSRFDSKPWILLGLMLIGMVGGMIRLIRRAMKDSQD
jgi:F0F1-type ATP synthase assembly protein I